MIDLPWSSFTTAIFSSSSTKLSSSCSHPIFLPILHMTLTKETIYQSKRSLTFARWINSLPQSFAGSNVNDILTSLVATTSTDMPKSSNVVNTCARYSVWDIKHSQIKISSNYITLARKPYCPSIRVLAMSNMVTLRFRTMLVSTAYKELKEGEGVIDIDITSLKTHLCHKPYSCLLIW